MGLFKNDRRKLEEALDSLRGFIGTQSSFSGDVENHSGIAERVAQVTAASEQLRCKGRGNEVDTVIDAVYDSKLPIAVLGSGDQVVAEIERLEELEKDAELDLPPIKGSGTAAQAEEARREEIALLGTKRREARAYWRSVLDNLRDSRADTQLASIHRFHPAGWDRVA